MSKYRLFINNEIVFEGNGIFNVFHYLYLKVKPGDTVEIFQAYFNAKWKLVDGCTWKEKLDNRNKLFSTYPTV